MSNLIASSSQNGIADVLLSIFELGGFVIFFILLVQIAFIVLCVNIARNKGYGALGWGILAFFTGFIALVILLCLPDLTLFYNGASKHGTISWVCKNCGQLHYNSYTKCTTCGKDRFTTAPVSQTTKTNQTAQPMQTQNKNVGWTCPNCGKINNLNARNCVNCFTEKP